MPVVPTTNGLSVGPRPLPQIRTSQEDFGGGQAAERPDFSGLGQAALNIYQAEKQKADQVATLDAGSKLSALETSLLYGENGALSQRGKNAFSQPEAVRTAWEKGIADIGGGLTNNEQRASFNQMVASHWTSVQSQVQRHVANERQQYDDQAISSYVGNEHARALAAFDNPNVVEQSIGNQVAAIKDHSARNGLPSETTKELTDKATSQTRLGVLTQFLDNGQDLNASKYLDAHRNDFVGPDLLQAERLTEAGSVRGEGQRHADQITSGFDGMLSQGNIDLTHRPRVQNEDGSISTVRSMSFEKDGKEILIPTVSDDGRILSNDEAIAEYERTGKNLGTFRDANAADAYAQRLHEAQADMLQGRGNGVPLGGAASLSDALRQVSQISDVRIRDEADQRVRRFYADQATTQRQQRDQAFQSASSIIEQSGGDFDKIPLATRMLLSPEENTALQHRADELRHPRRYTDPDVYHNLMNMAGLPGSRDDFLKLNLLPYRASLSDQDYQKLVTMQTQARVSDQHHDEAVQRSDSLRAESRARSDSLKAETRARQDSTRKAREAAKAAATNPDSIRAKIDAFLGKPTTQNKAPGGPLNKPAGNVPIPLKPISMGGPSVPQEWVDHALTNDPEYADYLEHMGVNLG